MRKLTVGSLFSGIGGFDLAAERVGMRHGFLCEIDPACQKVLAHHFPGVPIHSDVRELRASNLPTVDVLVGGFPCQDLSVAGKRAGLAGERSGLFFEFARVAADLAPRWLVIENVPGLISSFSPVESPPSGVRAGRRWEVEETSDLGIVLSVLGELGYGWAFRILDAQYDNLAQRRERVFVVGCLGDAARAASVLFEPESGEGHPPPSRASGQGAAARAQDGARTTGTLASNGDQHRGFRGGDGQAVAAIAGSQTARYGKGPDSDAGDPLVYQCQGTNVGEMGTLRGGNGHLTGGVPFCIHADALGRDGISRTPGPDAEGRVRLRDAGMGIIEGASYSLTATAPHAIAHALRAEGADASEDGTGRGTPLVPLFAAGCWGNRNAGVGKQGDPSFALDTTGAMAVGNSMAVRRLTPVECERLQGFPDGWTEGQSDSTRYRQLGNAVAVPVVEWILRRIVDAESAR